jgi:uncharacterized integral membrane protein
MGIIILVITIAVVVTLFSVQNAMPVSISFFVWKFDASLAIIALLFFLAGMVTATVVLFWIRLRKNMRKKRLKANEESGQKPGLE